jgi:hypothetical protein
MRRILTHEQALEIDPNAVQELLKLSLSGHKLSQSFIPGPSDDAWVYFFQRRPPKGYSTPWVSLTSRKEASREEALEIIRLAEENLSGCESTLHFAGYRVPASVSTRLPAEIEKFRLLRALKVYPDMVVRKHLSSMDFLLWFNSIHKGETFRQFRDHTLKLEEEENT